MSSVVQKHKRREHRFRILAHRTRRFFYGMWTTTAARPAMKVAIVLMVLALVSAVGLHQAEKDLSESYATMAKTFRSVFVLLVSGFDVHEPTSWSGWMCAAVTMILGIALVALVTADLASHLVRLALRPQASQSVSVKDHFIICGWGRNDPFLLESLTSDSLPKLRHVVIIDELLSQVPSNDPYVHYINGNPSEESVLERAAIKDAEVTIIPLDWRITSDTLKDSVNTLIMLAVEARSEKTYSCVEIVRRDSKRHLSRTRADEVVCVGDLSLRLLTQAALNHGLSWFLSDVLSIGSESKVHKEALPSTLAGLTFRQLFLLLNEHLEEILLAVERAGEIYANPTQRFPLGPDDSLFLLGDSSPEDLEALAAAVRRETVTVPLPRIQPAGTAVDIPPTDSTTAGA